MRLFIVCRLLVALVECRVVNSESVVLVKNELVGPMIFLFIR